MFMELPGVYSSKDGGVGGSAVYRIGGFPVDGIG